MSRVKFCQQENDAKEMAKDLVAFYDFQNLILKVRFFEDFIRKWVRSVGIKNPGFLPARS